MTSTAGMGDYRVPEWSVPDRFRKAREDRGLSQEQFARETGLSRRMISAIESGEREPKLKEYNLWQMATGVPKGWLAGNVRPEGFEPPTFCSGVFGGPKSGEVIDLRELVEWDRELAEAS